MFTPSFSFNQPPAWTLLFTSYDISLCFRLAALAKQVFEPDYLMLDTMKDRYWSQHTDGLMFTVKVYIVYSSLQVKVDIFAKISLTFNYSVETM